MSTGKSVCIVFLTFLCVCFYVVVFMIDTYDCVGLTLRHLNFSVDDIVTIVANVRKIGNRNNIIVHKFEKLCELYDNYRELAEQWRKGRKRTKVKHDLAVGHPSALQHLHAHATGNTTRRSYSRNGRWDV